MNCLWPYLLLTLLLLQATLSTPSPFTSDLFETWCQEHGKTYSSDQEKLHRFKVFQDNNAYVTQHNSMSNSSYTLSLNAFADLTHQEFKASQLGFSQSDRTNGSIRRLDLGGGGWSGLLLEPPVSVDWRNFAAVTPVKDQMRDMCDSSWSFSAVGAIEGINRIVTGSLVSLSAQELIDCDWFYNKGCSGGLMDFAYQFVVKNKGINTEIDYPYRAKDNFGCDMDRLERRVVTIDGYIDIPAEDEKQLLQAVARQPVSVAICGSDQDFQFYSKGILSGWCCHSLSQGLLIVGYDSKDGVDYWIVKNSWGEGWGMNGYIHIARNTGNSKGVCGINMLASYPIKRNPNPPTPPPSGPTRCNVFNSCPPGQTCCCGYTFWGYCLSYSCCEWSSAVCCKDQIHCCPSDYPICDTKKNQCLTHRGNVTLVKEAKKKGGSSGLLGGLNFLGEQLVTLMR